MSTKISVSGVTYPNSSITDQHYPKYVSTTLSGTTITSMPSHSRRIVINVNVAPVTAGGYLTLIFSSRTNGASVGSTYHGGSLTSFDYAGNVQTESSVLTDAFSDPHVKLTTTTNLTISAATLYFDGIVYIDRIDEFNGTSPLYMVSWQLMAIDYNSEGVMCHGTCLVALQTGQSNYLKNIGMSNNDSTMNRAQFVTAY